MDKKQRDEEAKMLCERALAPVEEPPAEPTLEKAQFSSQFINMMAMKASHALDEHLKNDPEGRQLAESMYCLLLFQIYRSQNPRGEVKWFNNLMAAEAVGEISHLVEWEVE